MIQWVVRSTAIYKIYTANQVMKTGRFDLFIVLSCYKLWQLYNKQFASCNTWRRSTYVQIKRPFLIWSPSCAPCSRIQFIIVPTAINLIKMFQNTWMKKHYSHTLYHSSRQWTMSLWWRSKETCLNPIQAHCIHILWVSINFSSDHNFIQLCGIL